MRGKPSLDVLDGRVKRDLFVAVSTISCRRGSGKRTFSTLTIGHFGCSSWYGSDGSVTGLLQSFHLGLPLSLNSTSSACERRSSGPAGAGVLVPLKLVCLLGAVGTRGIGAWEWKEKDRRGFEIGGDEKAWTLRAAVEGSYGGGGGKGWPGAKGGCGGRGEEYW